MLTHRLSHLALTTLICSSVLFGQDTATLSGTIVDTSNAVVPEAELSLLDVRRGAVRQTRSNGMGVYMFSGLPAGDYSLEVSKPGFNRLKVEQLRLNVRDRTSLQLGLEAAPFEPTVVTVTAGMQGISSDPSTGTAVEHDYAENLPINDRSVDSLVAISPGITSPGGGQFNANGLRSNTNYYTLDGVSSEISVGGGLMGGGGGPDGGAGPGGQTGMISLDALEEIRVQTSTFAPEFGRSPGAQISLTSRSGANAFHGSAYEYLRNERLNANDWFANSTGLPRGKMRNNEFGGTLSGPLKQNRTYFFASYEGIRSLQPQTALTNVPDLAIRENVTPELQPYLNAFPLPNGQQLDDNVSQYTAIVSNRSTRDSMSLRLDHIINDRLNLFARYSYTPSDGNSRGSGFSSPNNLVDRDSLSKIFTTSLTWMPSVQTTNDLRVNISTSSSNSHSAMDGFGGAVPLTDELVFPAGIISPIGSFMLNIAGAGGYSYGMTSSGKQHQINVVESISHIRGNHSFKFGADVRRLAPTNYNQPYQVSVMFNGLSNETGGFLSGYATSAVVSSNVAAVYPVYFNFSAYAQDTWKATNRTTLTYGLRWDVNPAPDVRRGSPLIALSSASWGASINRLDPLYKTRWRDIAPRIGLAYQLDTTPGREMIFRTGLGLFHDVGYGVTTGAFSGAPYVSQRTEIEPEFPLSTQIMAAPSLPATRPYGRISAADPLLQSPKVYQWNMTIERMFGYGQSFSIGYVSTKGSRLLQVEMRRTLQDEDDDTLQAYDILQLATNGAESDYHGMQLQFRRRLSQTLQMQVSYTYGHSIDSSSSDSSMGGVFATLLGYERGDSNFDIRQNLSFSGSYNFPAPKSGLLHMICGNWWTDWMVTARTGLPFDVRGISEVTSDEDEDEKQGLFAQVRPNVVEEQPIWLDDAQAPGGRRLNPDAFEIPDDFEQGNLGRNVLRGFNLFQADASLRRQFTFSERLQVHVALQAFNVFNNPNFVNPSADEGANLASPNFGVATRTLGQSMSGGFSSQYQTGGPRSLQFALRLQF